MNTMGRTKSFFAVLILMICTCLFSMSISAQTLDAKTSKGTEFIFSFLQGAPNVGAMSLFISSEVGASVVVEVPGLGSTRFFDVQPHSTITVSIPSFNPRMRYGEVSNSGIRVTSDNPISVYGQARISNSTDAFLALPVSVLGMDYVAMSFNGISQNYPAELLVVGVEDNTEVTIVSPVDTSSGPSGEPITITLNRMETFVLGANQTLDLTGTRVQANRPIAVVSGTACANVPVPVNACDHLVEMMPPTEAWGNSFVTYPLAQRLKGDIVRVLANEDNTRVIFNGELVATLAGDDYYEAVVTTSTVIQSSKRILVAQYSVGQQYDDVPSDPFMMLVPPTEQFLDRYTFSTSPTGFTNHFVNLVVRTSALEHLRFDGKALSPDLFMPIGSSGYSGAHILIEPGSHTVASSDPFGLYVYGFGDYDSYGFPGGMSLDVLSSGDIDYRNVRVISYLDTTGVELDVGSFAVVPDRVEFFDDRLEIEWLLPEFSIGQVHDLEYEVIARNLFAGERRVVTSRLEIVYQDLFGVEQKRTLGEQAIEVLGAEFSLGVTTAHSSYSVGQDIDILVQLTNTGDLQEVVVVNVSVIDVDGNIVGLVNTPSSFALHPSESVTLDSLKFIATNVYAGNYSIRAELKNGDGVQVAEANAPFEILSSSPLNVSAELSINQSSFTFRDNIEIQGRIINPATNIALENIRVVTLIRPTSGNIYWTQTEHIDHVSAQSFVDFHYSVPLNELIPRFYSVHMRVYLADGSLINFEQASFMVVDNPMAALSSSVVVASAVLDVGDEQTCTYTILNQSPRTALSQQFTTLVVNVESEAEISSVTEVLTLAPQEAATLVRPIPASDLNQGEYACVLQTTVDDVAENLVHAQFTVNGLASDLAADISLGGQGRLLVLLDEHAVSETYAYLTQKLSESSWLYTLVDNEAEFHEELLNGGYSLYALLGESIALTPTTQELLSMKIALGDGLVVASGGQHLNQLLEEVLGIDVSSSPVFAPGVALHPSDLGDSWEHAFSVPAKVLGFTSAGAEVIGEYWDDAMGPAIHTPYALGAASDFNAFIFENFVSSSSTVEGRLAVGGDLSLQHFSVGDKLDATTLTDVVLVGGDVVFPSGRVYYGNLIAAGSVAGVGNPVIYGMTNGASVMGNQSLPVDFSAERKYLEALSVRIGELMANGTVSLQWGGYHLAGDCISDLQVFSIPASEMQNVHTFAVSCIPASATVIFNILGEESTIRNVGFQSLSAIRQRVLFNFPQATSVTLTSVGIEGSILAPFAHFQNPAGNVSGQLIARSWSSTNYGYVSISHHPFEGDLSAVLQAPARHAVATHQYQEGKTIFIGFDVLAEAVSLANVSSNSVNPFEELLLSALNHINPPVLPIRAGKVLPFLLEIHNEGSTVANGRALLNLGGDLSMIQAGHLVLLPNTADSWSYGFALPVGQAEHQKIHIRMPDASDESAALHWLIQSGSAPDWVNQVEKTLYLHTQ